MNLKEKREVLKHITLGTNEVLYYPYTEGKQPLPLRPISTWELDDCFYRALDETPENIANFIVKVKLDLIDRKTNINVENTGYVKLQKFYNTIDYWIVYYAMKDFQDEEFSMPDYEIDDLPRGFRIVKKMSKIHEIAKFVMTASYQNKDVIKEIFTDENGKEIAIQYLYLNIPISDISNITALQKEYIVYSKLHLDNSIRGDINKSKYSISGKKMTVKEIMEKFI